MKKTFLIIIIVCIISATVLTLISISNISLTSKSYVTFSDGIVIEYPANWYKYSDEFTRENSLPSLSSNNKFDPYNGVNAGVGDSTTNLNGKGIFDVAHAIEAIEKNTMSDVIINKTAELISKDLKENIGTIKFKYFWLPRNATLHAFYKIIKCNEKLFQLTIGTSEPFNSEYDAEIEHLINSFRCK